jgi:hypothetical protein
MTAREAGEPMKKATDFLKHAKACRSLAKQMEVGAQRDQLIKMAETCEILAAEATANKPQSET